LASTSGSGPPYPSFLPPDPRVEEPYLLTPQMAMRVAILGAVALVAFAVLLLRLWSLQILAPEVHRQAALENQLRRLPIDAPRGPILDRSGRVLVRNVASNAVVLWPASLPKGDGRHTELRRLSELLDIPFWKLRALIRRHRSEPITPVTLRVAVHPAKVAYLYEHASEFPGVRIKQTYLRYYNSESLFAQGLGYVGEISEEQLERMRRDGYRAGDRIGQSGVEAAYDKWLRGAPGIEELRVDSLGRLKGGLTITEAPQPGKAVRLTIDIGLQRAAERALTFGIALARENGEWAADGGAIVALDPNSGDVLAMASSPTYRPSVYAGRIDPDEIKPLLDAKVARQANYPGLNRVTSAIYPPGSVFKPVTALSALQEHVVTPYSPLACTGTYTVPGVTGPGQTFRNWDTGVSRMMAMSEAIAASCDTYFYRLGYAFYGLPPERGHPLQAWASRFGLGGSTGIDIGPEERGILPTPEWREATYTKETDPCCWRIDRIWKPGDSIQLSIGQKDIAVTPLQMARFYAMIANGGKLVTPHVVADVEEPGGSNAAPTVIRSYQPPPAQDSGVDPTALQVVRDSLLDATHASYGTSSAVFGNFPIPVAGKTGTAEKVVQLPGYSTGLLLDQSWWCGYAPADRPTIALCAVIENGGHGGSAAAPAALKVFERFFRVKAPAIGEIHSD
jgi:penicillin-binding protein 2